MMGDSSNNALPSEISRTSASRDQQGRCPRWKVVSLSGARLPPMISDIFRSKSAAFGLAILLFWVFIALAAPLICTYSPTEMPSSRLQWPSRQHWLGTDHLGRDVMSRLFWGTRTVLLLAPLATLLGVLGGASLGLISGYSGGRVDMLIMRGCDILLSFPMLLIYILIITSIGASALNVVISISLGAVPSITRIVRSLVLQARTQDYVSAARLRGERRWYILVREIFPNVSGPIIVDACIRVGYAVMAIGSLGFLGLGIPPPAPDWGGMINEGRAWIFRMPWIVLAPATALSSVVVALNMLSDGIKEAAQQR